MTHTPTPYGIDSDDDIPFLTEEEEKALAPKPNQDQEAALDAFFEFMLSDNLEYHLTGPAGTGKTFTLDLIMNEGMKRYEEACVLMDIEQTIFSMQLTATTNKAAEVLSIATGKPASTIHSLMGFKVQEDYQTGETKITVTNNTVVRQHELIIIDEASMIDAKLYSLIHKYAHKCKFLYVGDHCQMAPVFENISKIYQNKSYFSNLTIPMRNSGQPALMALCDQLRTSVETNTFRPIQEVPGVIEYLDGNAMQKKINSIFLDHNPDSRILCFRNAQVKDFNSYIRELRQLPSYYEEGEYLVNAASYAVGEFRLSIEEVVQVFSNPHKEITKNVQGIEFNVYELKLRKKNGAMFTGLLPSDPDHFNRCVKYFANNKMWPSYFHMKQMYLDLRPKDACTVYKAQGSTYHSVFLDLQDISKCTHANQVARMLYVGATRPTTKLYLYGNLKEAYRGA